MLTYLHAFKTEIRWRLLCMMGSFSTAAMLFYVYGESALQQAEDDDESEEKKQWAIAHSSSASEEQKQWAIAHSSSASEPPTPSSSSPPAPSRWHDTVLIWDRFFRQKFWMVGNQSENSQTFFCRKKRVFGFWLIFFFFLSPNKNFSNSQRMRSQSIT